MTVRGTPQWQYPKGEGLQRFSSQEMFEWMKTLYHDLILVNIISRPKFNMEDMYDKHIRSTHNETKVIMDG